MDTTQAQAESQPASAAPTGADTQPSLDSVSLEDMDAVQTAAATQVAEKPAGSESTETGKPEKEAPAKEEPAPPEKPEKTEPVVAETEPPVIEEPVVATEAPVIEEPAKPTKPEEPEATGELPERFRFKNPQDRAIAAVKKAADAAGHPITFAEAERRVLGDQPATEVPVDPIEAAQGTIETITGEIAVLEKQIDPDNEEEILSTKEQRKATVQLAEKRQALTEAKLELRDATREVEAQRRTVAQKQATARTESTNRAKELYPDAASDQTVLGKAIAQRFEEMKNPAHPEHPILYADTAPERVAQIVASELGIAPKSKASTAKPTPPAAPPPKKATPVSGAKTAIPEKPAEVTKDKNSVEYLQSDEASLAELDAAFGADKGIAIAIR